MAVSLREYRARIKSTESMKKITRAMELIAASRIIKAQQREGRGARGRGRRAGADRQAEARLTHGRIAA
jgi:F-type H+-transporting ATPase subunit gamma